MNKKSDQGFHTPAIQEFSRTPGITDALADYKSAIQQTASTACLRYQDRGLTHPVT
jgi:hypothetical protein